MKSSLIAKASADFDLVVKEKFRTPDFEVASGLVRSENIARSNALNRYQPIIFWISTTTGFFAAIWLVIASASEAAGIKIIFQMM